MPDLTDIMAHVSATLANAPSGSRLSRVVRSDLGVIHTAELDRILLIPRRTESPDTIADTLTAAYRTPTGTQNLRPIQAQALCELHDTGGLFGPIRVGAGKTLISLLAPVVLEARSPVLLVPAHLIEKTEREARLLAQHWQIPSFLRIVSYQMLGRVQGNDILDRYSPDLLICDEAHRLKNRKAAVTRRVLRYLKSHPETRLCAMSGTVTKRSLQDFAHILEYTHREATPLPRTHNELEAWSSVVDEKPGSLQRYQPGALLQLAGPADRHADPYTVARRAVRRRIVETPGCVATTAGVHDSSLSLTGILIPPDTVTIEHFTKLRDLWETPDGWPMADGMSVWRHARELALGFFYRWDPRPPEEWLTARKAWAKFCRGVLSDNHRNLDSELQVAQACTQHPEWYGDTDYSAWTAVRDTFKPHTVPVWFSDSALTHATCWLSDNDPGLVWCEHVAFARKLSELTHVPYYGRKGVTDDGDYIEDRLGSAILSVEANSTGRNLQKWSRNLVVSPPPNGLQWEQLIGRTHRSGQEADEVTVHAFLACLEHVAALEQAQRDSRYQQDLTGQIQLLSVADITLPSPPHIGSVWNK